MTRYRVNNLTILAGLLGLWGLLWWPLIIEGDVLFTKDILFHWVPIKAYWIERISAGEIPWWNPYVSLGMPYYADIGNQTLYPGNIVFLFTSNVLKGISWFIAIHSFLMMISMSRLLHELEHNAFTCWFGAAIFALSGVAASSVINLTYVPAFVWVPFGLACLVGKNPRVQFIGPSIATILIFLAGDPLNAGVLLLITCVWQLLPRTTTLNYRKLAVPAATIVVVFVLSAVQWVPTLDLLTLTDMQSPTEHVLSWSFPPRRLIEFIQPNFFQTALEYKTALGFTMSPISSLYPVSGSPWFRNIYIGFIPVLLALYAMAARQGLFWGVLLVFCLVLSFGRWLPGLDLIFDTFPLLRSQRYPEKLIFWVTLCLVILAAMGLKTLPGLLKNRIGSMQRVIATAVIVIVVVFVLGYWPVQKLLPVSGSGVSEYWTSRLPGHPSYLQGIAIHTLAVAGLLIVMIWIKARWRQTGLIVLCFLAVADLVWIQRDQMTFSPADTVEPAAMPVVYSALRSAGYRGESAIFFDIDNKIPSLSAELIDRVRMSLGHNASNTSIVNKSKYRYVREQMLPNIGSMYGIRQLGGGLIRLQPKHLNRRVTKKAHAENSGVRFIVVRLGTDKQDWNLPGVIERYRDEVFSFRILELERTAPRFAWATSNNKGVEFCNFPIVDKNKCPGTRGIVVRSQAPERIVLDINTPFQETGSTDGVQKLPTKLTKPAILHLAQTFDPAWQASLDGRAIPLQRTQYGLTTVAVDYGKHELVLTYHPMKINFAFAVSLLGLLIILLGLNSVSVTGLLEARKPHR